MPKIMSNIRAHNNISSSHSSVIDMINTEVAKIAPENWRTKYCKEIIINLQYSGDSELI